MNKDPKQEVDDELRFHLEERTRDYVARGLSPDKAREAAAQRFGDTTRVREACAALLVAERTAEERRARVTMSWLDVRLGLRMLAKYPGLSLVAAGGMAIAIAFGAGYFALVGSFLDSRVPIEGGDRRCPRSRSRTRFPEPRDAERSRRKAMLRSSLRT